MKKEFSTVLRLSALTIALLAAGCGGGGGGSSDDTPATAATRSVSGTAAKGLIKNGVVKVYALDAQGNKGSSPVATGTTGADGTFTVAVPKEVLLFVVEVSAGANTVMADEATGTDLPMPSSMTLRNIVTLAEGTGTYTGAVTPLTEMAVQAAEKATGGLTEANIRQAKAELIGRFGFDPENVKPVNSNSAEAANATDEQKKQALILAGISMMAKEGDDSLGCVAADLACVVEKVAVAAGNGSIATIVSKLETKASEVAQDATINKTNTTTVQLPNKPAAPVVAETAAVSAKKLFASLRTNLNALDKDGSELEKRADLVSADLDKMIAPVDQDLAGWLQSSMAAVSYFNAFKAGQTSAAELQLFDVNGFCRVTSDSSFRVAATSAGDATGIFCSLNRKSIAFLNTADGLAVRDVVQTIAISPTSDGTVYKYSAVTRQETSLITSGGRLRDATKDVVIGVYGASPSDRATGTITYAPSNAGGTVAIKGMLPARVDYSGTKLSDHELWDLSAKTSYDQTAQETTYEIASTMTSVLAGAQTGTVSINPGSVLRVNAAPGYLASNVIKAFNLSITGASGSSSVTGSLSMTGWMKDKSGQMGAPTNAVFKGSLKQGGSPFFTGEVKYTNAAGFSQYDSTLPISDDNFLAHTVRLSGELAIPSRPPLMMFLAVTPAKGGVYELTAQYNDGDSVINFTGKRGSDGKLSSATISSTSGISVALTEQDLANKQTVNVKKGDEIAATLNLDTGVIYYNDADKTFESLK